LEGGKGKREIELGKEKWGKKKEEEIGKAAETRKTRKSKSV